MSAAAALRATQGYGRRACRLSGRRRRAGARPRISTPRWRGASPRSGWKRLLGTAAPSTGKASPSTPQPAGPRKVALIVGNGAYRNVADAGQPAARRQADRDTFRDLGFATVTLAPDLTRDKFFATLHEFGMRGREGGLGRGLLCRSRHGDRRRQLSDPDRRQAAADSDAETQAVALEQVIAAVSRRAQTAPGDARRLPRQSLRKDHAADDRAEAGQPAASPTSSRRPASWWSMPPSTARPRSTAIPPTARSPPRWRANQGAEGRGAKAVRHRPRRRLEGDQSRAAAVHLRLVAGPRGFLLRGGEVADPHGEEAR